MKAEIFVSAVMLAALPLVAPAPTAQTPSGTTTKGEQQVTVTGCVQREADYRKAQDKGRGGVAGTGVGAENEFVLTNVSPAGDSKKSDIAANAALELTGANEKLAAPHINHRVEITGTLKAAEVGASGKPTGGATAGKPPSGVDVLSKDLQLRELEIATLKMISANCETK